MRGLRFGQTMDHCVVQQKCLFDWVTGNKKHYYDGDSSDDEEESRQSSYHRQRKQVRAHMAKGESVISACWADTNIYFETLDAKAWYVDCKLPETELQAQLQVDLKLVQYVQETILKRPYFTMPVTGILERISPQPNALVHRGPKDQQHSAQYEQLTELTPEEQECLGNFYYYLIDLLRLVFIRIGALEKVHTQVPVAYANVTQIFSYLMGLRLLVLRQVYQIPMLKGVDTSPEYLLEHITPRDGALLVTMDKKQAELQALNAKIELTDNAKAKLQNERDTLMASYQMIKSDLNMTQRARAQLLDIPYIIGFFNQKYGEESSKETPQASGRSKLFNAVRGLTVKP